MKKCLEFINQVRPEGIGLSAVISNKPILYDEEMACGEFLADTVFLTKQELALIKRKKYPSILKWTSDQFKGARVVEDDTIKKNFSDYASSVDHLSGWVDFYKRFGSGYARFSTPIFLRKETYCLFYSSYSCGLLCGEGRLRLYKNLNGK